MMAFHRVPQPSAGRMVPVPGHPLVVAVVPGQSELVALTAAAWSDALGGVPLYFGYVDESRIVDEEFPDGSVRHTDLDPDQADDDWEERERAIRAFLTETLADHAGPWSSATWPDAPPAHSRTSPAPWTRPPSSWVPGVPRVLNGCANSWPNRSPCTSVDTSTGR